MDQENPSPENFHFTTSKEPNSYSFWATELIFLSKKRNIVIYKVTESFSNSEKKLRRPDFQFLGKNSFKKNVRLEN